MKKVLSTVAVFMILMTSVFTTMAKGILVETDTYTIFTNEAVATDVNFEKSWTIEYTSTEKAITVLKRATKNGDEYLVRNNFFEVRYTNTDKGFSVKRVKGSDSKVDATINDAVLNAEMFGQQALLSSEKLSEEKALGYIAAFVPQLLNDNYKHILN